MVGCPRQVAAPRHPASRAVREAQPQLAARTANAAQDARIRRPRRPTTGCSSQASTGLGEPASSDLGGGCLGLAEKFLTYSKTNNKVSSVVAKDQVLRIHLIPFFGEKKLDAIRYLAFHVLETERRNIADGSLVAAGLRFVAEQR